MHWITETNGTGSIVPWISLYTGCTDGNIQSGTGAYDCTVVSSRNLHCICALTGDQCSDLKKKKKKKLNMVRFLALQLGCTVMSTKLFLLLWCVCSWCNGVKVGDEIRELLFSLPRMVEDQVRPVLPHKLSLSSCTLYGRDGDLCDSTSQKCLLQKSWMWKK